MRSSPEIPGAWKYHETEYSFERYTNGKRGTDYIISSPRKRIGESVLKELDEKCDACGNEITRVDNFKIVVCAGKEEVLLLSRLASGSLRNARTSPVVIVVVPATPTPTPTPTSSSSSPDLVSWSRVSDAATFSTGWINTRKFRHDVSGSSPPAS